MRRDYGFLAAKVLALVAAALVFGCAPPSQTAPAPNRAAALKNAGAALVSTGDWNCPSGGDANVNLKDGINFDGYDFSGNDDFEVCYSNSNGANLKITGTSDWQSICVYPMQAGTTGAPKMAGQPQCYDITGAPITPNFPAGTTFNYVVIVKADFTDALTSCLSDSTPCPPHAEGFIK